ncbi:hypothetical protein Patl1_27435 [Pistacia atlantica]|uniref:Uncharacterized protein n=1 Tax=Pistacia atlantica TaxID=434234 RepID=A0ACC1BE56_9ROSI|nr:hypothetical protein Patl1_27435 [Pistacia atlantica]
MMILLLPCRLEQNNLLQHATTIYLHHTIADFAEALPSKVSGNLKVVYFVNSGTEANELAMLMAILYCGNLGMIALRNAYNGGSSNTIGLTTLNTWKYPIPQGVGGTVEWAPGCLKHVYHIVHKAGGVINDEVQTGFGLTGSHYWGFQTQWVVPDIVTMAKKIQFKTFGGNLVCSVGGVVVLRIMDKEKRQAHCADVFLLMLWTMQFQSYESISLLRAWENHHQRLAISIDIFQRMIVIILNAILIESPRVLIAIDLNIAVGKMQCLFDERGMQYLDAFAGIVTVSWGHCHPDLVNAITQQNNLLQHATIIYLHHAIEANELAMLMARLYSGNLGMIALRNAYHGGSSNTIGLTALNMWKYPIPQLKLVISGTLGINSISFFSHTLFARGVGGAVELATGYLKHVYDIVCKVGGVCIADEVQTGFGRTGSHYWGFQTQGVIPDIVTVAKGIGDGLPLRAVMTTSGIASVMAQKIHFNTFGRNPICSVGGFGAQGYR